MIWDICPEEAEKYRETSSPKKKYNSGKPVIFNSPKRKKSNDNLKYHNY
jgi:hypothetical protein